MPTTNPRLTEAWSQIAANTNADLLVTWSAPAIVEVATTSANAAPAAGVEGHRMTNQDAITRSVIGPGYVWARLISGSYPANIALVVTK